MPLATTSSDLLSIVPRTSPRNAHRRHDCGRLAPQSFLCALPDVTNFELHCGSAVNESVLGCALQLYIPADATQPFSEDASAVDPMVMRVSLGYRHLDVVRIVVGAVDGAGNVGRNATFVWRVDTEASVREACGVWVRGGGVLYACMLNSSLALLLLVVANPTPLPISNHLQRWTRHLVQTCCLLNAIVAAL